MRPDRRLGLLALLVATAGCRPTPAPAGPAFAVVDSTRIGSVTQLEVAYPSDSLTVRGFLFVPDGEGPGPAVVFNHGGVTGVSEDMKRRGRHLAGLGYVVFAPAYRGEGGSEGVVEVAAGEVDDMLAGTAILAAHPRVDAARIGAAGSSHGALIAVLAAAREPGRFRCLVEACGVMDIHAWYRYLVENGFEVGDSLSVAVYGHGPQDRPEAFTRRSAVRVAAALRTPLLIQHGVLDRIVPVEQAGIFEEALRAEGHREVTRREYPLLGHAFWFWDDPSRHGPEEIAEANAAWADFTGFLAKHLGLS